jgi:mycothiol synthase
VNKQPIVEPLLSPGLSLRPIKWADAEAVAQLIYDGCVADGDVIAALTPEEIRQEWESDRFNLETDAILIETEDGHVVGYEELTSRHTYSRLNFDGYVHPEFKGRGIGTMLLRTLETRARQEMAKAEPDVRVVVRCTMSSGDVDGRQLHENEGYRPVRYQYRMEIKLEEAPPAPIWPAGIEVRPFIREQHERAVWQALNESFRDLWESQEFSFKDFVHNKYDDPEYDPALWLIAWDGDEVAGISLNRYRMGIGWIRNLGVRRPWRKKGLGLALLQHSFGEFYKLGTRTVGLGVDASNPTGATRLYERAGMYVASEFVIYEKELRPGREPWAES